MLSTIQSLGLLGIDPFPVTVEVNVARAMPAFDIVGLPDAAVQRIARAGAFRPLQLRLSLP